MDEKFSTPHLYSALRVSTTTRDRYNEYTTAQGSGTGFVVSTGEGRYLVTNRHVIEPKFAEKNRVKYFTHELESVSLFGYYQLARDHREEPIRIEMPVPDPVPYFSQDEEIDLAVVPLPAAIPSTRINSLSTSVFATPRQVSEGLIYTGGPLLMPGYPGSGGSTSERPILVSGSIASDPRYSAALGGKDFPNRVLCHSFSREGMSGAPVFGILPPTTDWTGEPVGEQLALLGVNTGHIDMTDEPSVLSLFVPAPAIVALIARTGDKAASDLLGWQSPAPGLAPTIWTPSE